VNFEYYVNVHNLDESQASTGLRVAPKITEAHIKPDPFQKMNVALATQVR